MVIEAVGFDQGISHTGPVRLHRVEVAVVVVPDVRVIEVGDLLSIVEASHREFN